MIKPNDKPRTKLVLTTNGDGIVACKATLTGTWHETMADNLHIIRSLISNLIDQRKCPAKPPGDGA